MVYMHALYTTYPMLKITWLAISQKLVNQKQNSKYPSLQKFGNFFDIWVIGT